jgi:RHS repeat-associated protein
VGDLLLSETHYFLALKAEFRTCRPIQSALDFSSDGTHYEKWQNAKEFRVEKLTGTGTHVTVRDWQQRAPVVWGADPGLSYNTFATSKGQEDITNDTRVAWEETTLENGKKKRTELGYDQFNNVSSVKEYDFGDTSGNAGALLRQTTRTYASSLNGYCYTNLSATDGTCGNGLSPDVNSIVHQRRLLVNETIKDAAGNQKAYSEFEYDNYNADTNHAPVLTNAGMIQFDGAQFSLFSSSNQPRGNVTKATRWAGGSSYISTFSQYDNAGNVIWAKDPRGFVSTVSYADNFGNGSNPDAGALGTNGATYAFVTLATNALGQQAKSQFDYTRGVTTGVKDPNGIIAKTEYDLIGRPTRVTAALGLPEQAIAETAYPTATSNVSTVSRQLDATRWLASKTSLDGFDRPVIGWQAEDGQHASIASFSIRADTVYDALGRGKQTSNPYRPGAGESAIYSTTTYDLAGRVVSVTTPDNAVVNSYYNGNQVMVKDQANKERMSQTNALGQLTDVWEITTADDATEQIGFPNRPEVTAGYRTKYDYNTLGNLITVTQRKGTTGIIQTRTFAYDPLSRLTSAMNPESGTVSYSYDDNGNLLTRTDSLVPAVTTTYAYDALNRATTRTYSEGTPAVTYAYDSASIPNGRGRLASVSSSVSSYSYSGYDALGRALGVTQTIGAQNYSISQTYNLAGHVKTITYPSDRSVTYSYDNAGRLNSFTGNLGDGTVRNYAIGITYGSSGSWTREQFGTTTALYNKRQYNNRQQLFDMRVSTVNDDMNWNRGAIVNYYSLISYYGGGTAADTNGNLYVQQHWIPNDDAISGYSMMQQNYGYDALNRINWMGEYQNGQTLTGSQTFGYDRWGNRTVSGSGTGINNKQFTVDTNTNRLSVPGGQSGTMSYDSAGNLTTDTYSGSAVTRVYDAENKMTSETTYNSVVAGSYSYDGDGRRVKRVVGSAETWQVYGLGGELLAEYAANAGASSPQKEYGYRNGELLVTASVTSGWGAPPVLNDNPLQVGITTVQARHITELRDAINSLRSHRSMSAYSWQYSATINDYISANPTLEMRTALDQALGAPSGGYAAGLAQGQPIKAIHIQELRDRLLTAWNSGSTFQINWLVADHLGTPRMIVDKSGALANVKRHDYLPFGEELFAGTGGRTTGQGYVGDNVRQKFTIKERDHETGLDYFLARYYSSTQGRFASPDEPFADQSEGDPQSWNLYAYAGNSPLIYTDPFGRWKQVQCTSGGGMCWQAEANDNYRTLAKTTGLFAGNLQSFFQNEVTPEGKIVDISGYQSWNESNRFGTVQGPFGGREFGPPVGGGLRIVGSAARAVSGPLSSFANWVRGGSRSPAPGAMTGSLNGLTQAERSMVQELLAQGKNVQIIPRATGKTADFLINGLKTELKTPTGTGANTLKNAIEAAAGKGTDVQILIDARGLPATSANAIKQIIRAQHNIGGLRGRVTVLTKEGRITY